MKKLFFAFFLLAILSLSFSTLAATTWYLAEGSTTGTYNTWILVANPNSTSAGVTLTYMKEDGTTAQQSITVSPTSRYSVNTNDNSDLDSSSFATKVDSTDGVGIVVERSVYWNVGSAVGAGGHCSRGATETGTIWYLSEGSTQGTYETWILIQNPNSSSASVTLTFMKNDGTTVQQSITVSPTSRYTLDANGVSDLSSSAFSTKIESTNGIEIVVERSMYWDVGSDENAAGHCSVGTR